MTAILTMAFLDERRELNMPSNYPGKELPGSSFVFLRYPAGVLSALEPHNVSDENRPPGLRNRGN